jgi:hypothetical protein
MAATLDKELFFQQIGYVPHSRGQQEFHKSNARFKVACCGRRYGKSTMAGRDVEPELFTPNKRFWIVGPTYDLGEKEFRVIWDDLIIGQKFGKEKRVKKSYNKRTGEMWIEMPWQSRIEVRSATHPEGLVGEALNGVIMSEAAKHKRETWERFIRPSLSDYRGWATFPTTPEGHNWLYELWLFGQDQSIPDYVSWRFPSWENPIVYPGGREDPEILQLETTTAVEWFLQEIGADFASFVGKIYSEFDETIHVKNLTFNSEWPNYIAFDWGFVNPLAAVEFQIDPWQNIHIWREHYLSYTALPEHLRIMRGRDQPDGYHIDCTYGDAADPEAAMTVSSDFAPCLAMPEAKQNWRQGIDLVKKFLKQYQIGEIDEYGTPKMAPKLFIDFSCSNTIREFGEYRAVDNPKSTLRESGATTAANKQDDHALDALRYALVHIFELGATHSLREVMNVNETLQSNNNSGVPAGGRGYFTSNMEF